MANYDPQLPNVQPENYIGWSRPISQPEADVSGATRGRSIGGFLRDVGQDIFLAAKTQDQATQMGITQDIHAGTDPIRQDQIQRLASIDSILNNNAVDRAAQAAPQDLKTQLQQAQTLGQARANGHVSDTYVQMQMYNLAKQLRTQYPGYRDYIDNEFSKITGERPANALVRSLTADINAATAKHDALDSKIQTQVLSMADKGDLPANVVQQAIETGNWRQAYLMGLPKAQARQAVEDQARVLSLKSASRDFNIEDQKTDIQNNIHRTVAANLDQWTINGPNGQPIKFHDVLMQAAQDPQSKSGPEAVLLAQAFDGFQNKLRADLNKTYLGNTNLGSGGDAYVSGVIDKELQSLNMVKESLAGKDLTQASLQSRMLNAAIDDRSRRWLMSIGGPQAPMMDIAALMKVPGIQNAPWLQKQIQSVVDTIVDPHSNRIVLDNIAKAVGQSENPKFTASGLQFTLPDSIKEYDQFKSSDSSRNKNINKTVEVAGSAIDDPSVPLEAKKSAVAFLYGDPTALDGIKSQTDDGKHSVAKDRLFSQMYNDQRTQAVLKQGQQAFQQYWAAASHAYANIFSGELQEINQSGRIPGVHWSWDNDNSMWDLKIDPGYSAASLGHDYQILIPAKNRLNMHLNEMKGILQAAGVAPNAFLAQMLINAGVNPKYINGETVPGQMYQALELGSTKPQKPKAEE